MPDNHLNPASIISGMKFNVIVEQGEDGYLLGEVVELPGCRTQAKDRDELTERIKEAISLYLKERPQETIPKVLEVQQVEVEGA